MVMQICHNDFDGKDYIQVIQNGCVILEVPLDMLREQENVMKQVKRVNVEDILKDGID